MWEQPPVPCHPIPGIPARHRGPIPPLCPWGPSPLPHGGRGLCRDRALPERRHWEHPQTFPATLACPGRGLYLDLQEEKPGERSLATYEPCLWLLYCSGEGGSETHCPSRPRLSPLTLTQLCGHRGPAGCCHPRPRALPAALWGLSPLFPTVFHAGGASSPKHPPETTRSVLVPSASSARTANPRTLLVPLQAQRQRQTWGHPRPCSPCPGALAAAQG